MHKNTTLISALLLACSSHGQVSIAPEAGFQMVGMRERTEELPYFFPKPEYKPSFRVGMNVSVDVSEKLNLHAGAFYALKGFNVSYNGTGLYWTNRSYIDIPLYLNYDILSNNGNTFFGGIGPYISYCLGGRTKVADFYFDPALEGYTYYTLTSGYGASAEVTAIDFGTNANLGFITSSGLYFRAQYSIGLANTIPQSEGKNSWKNRAFGISVGYQIKTKSAPSSNR